MTKYKPLLFCLFTCLIAACGNNNPNPSYGKAEWVETAGEVPTRELLDQNWNLETRNDFWFTSQGSHFIPYAWFTWLEQENSEELFRQTDNLYRLGYIPEVSSKDNLAGLPIGFALHNYQGEDWLGFTCAACHTAQVEYNGQSILVEGGPTMGNFMQFFYELLPALEETYNQPDKFQRFATRVLGENLSDQQNALLKEAISEQLRFYKNYLEVNSVPSHYPDDFAGFARIDAFGIIQNMASALAQDKLSNRNDIDAPVSYPVLWGANQSDRVQWNGSLGNGAYGLGPLARNTGEVVGVFGGLRVERAPLWQRLFRKNVYSGHINIANLGDIESMVRDLRSPQWDERHLPAIDREKAALGRAVYEGAGGCAGCHEIIPREDQDKPYCSRLVLQNVVGTDPRTTENAQNHMALTYLLEGTKEQIIAGEVFGSEAAAIRFANNGTFGMLLKDPIVAAQAALKSRRIEPDQLSLNSEHPMSESDAEAFLQSAIEEYVSAPEAEGLTATTNQNWCAQNTEIAKSNGYAYKARPHTGIWATAPYLHNGSVPTLRDMLKKPEDRPTEFWVGSREYDPINVGFVSTEVPDIQQSKFSVYQEDGITPLPGNSNAGHLFGTNLSEEQKDQLLEFLKTL